MKEINSLTPLNMNIPGGGFSSKDKSAELKKAVTEFEALFLNQMLKVMRETVNKSDLFHGGSGEEIYNSLFDEELSNLMAKSGGIGLGNILLSQIEGGSKGAKTGLQGEVEKDPAAGPSRTRAYRGKK